MVDERKYDRGDIVDAVLNDIELQANSRRVMGRNTNYIVMSRPVYGVLKYHCNQISGNCGDPTKYVEINVYMDMQIIVLDRDDMTLIIG